MGQPQSSNHLFKNIFFRLAFPKSPFERELHRLLNESSKNKVIPQKKNNLNQTAKPVNNQNNNATHPVKVLDSGDGVSKHFVGLEAIKEITRNKNLTEQNL